jgi:hypothetical protein
MIDKIASNKVKNINSCRLCGCDSFDVLIDLGTMALTGRFAPENSYSIPFSPLCLIKCRKCHLVQLQHTYPLNEMYNEQYGYRSSLNGSMVEHLHQKVSSLIRKYTINSGDIVIDIGSNDGTTLSFFPKNLIKVGFDPSAIKMRSLYQTDTTLILDFFSADRFEALFPNKKAQIITSIAMFYDLDDPLNFMHHIASILADNGIWHFEQSYLPSMLNTNAYDTICHEHLEYYAVNQIKYLTDMAGFKIIDITFNMINGGSFAVTASHKNAYYPEATELIGRILKNEQMIGLDTLVPYIEFVKRVKDHKYRFVNELKLMKKEGKTVIGYGASTKGNVILQYCDINSELISNIAEINPDKIGCVTPGTNIPIISEEDAKNRLPDCFVVFPWHYKTNILNKENLFRNSGGKFLFPLPVMHII